MHFIDTRETLDLSNRTTFFHDNVVVMEVDNLLAGWPTYTIDFTPERPGPLKLVLRLKDASSYRSTDDDDSEDEAEGTGKVECTPPAIEEDPDVTMACEATSKDGTRHVSAKPVQLHGIFKGGASIVRMREKFMQENDYTWLPRRWLQEDGCGTTHSCQFLHDDTCRCSGIKAGKERIKIQILHEEYLAAARCITRCVDMFCKIDKVIDIGTLLKQCELADPGDLSEDEDDAARREKQLSKLSQKTQDRYQKNYKRLLELAPALKPLISGSKDPKKASELRKII
ncbi:hypothetical protein EV424DRAFT_1545397 [Suillus variegatus]|nr:hypothetical protein EV424DRAFT_1545397 [Suillus variegatus]